MRIGALAERSGVPAKTIRYYEAVGLLPPAKRSDNGYRRYSDNDVAILRFIHRARRLGFSLTDVEKLLSLWSNRRRASADVKALAEKHIAEVDRRIDELQSMRTTLMHVIHQCHGDSRPDCPILDDLAGQLGSSD